jgi:hypothetical protein
MIFAIPEGGGGSRILTSPFQSATLDGLFIFYMISITSIIFGFLTGYLLGPFFLYIQKKMKGKKMLYHIVDKPNTKHKRTIFQAFFPALLTLNISFILIENEFVRYLVTGSTTEDLTYLYTALIAVFYISSAIALTLFSPVWFLNDSGIIFLKKEEIETNPEILNIGRWYSNVIKGYAGISVLLTFYSFIFRLVSLPGVLDEPGAIISLVAVPLFPFIIAFFMIPAIVIRDLTIDRRRKYILKTGQKMGINKYINISINEIEDRSSLK